MSGLLRWCRFSAVGLLGAAVQLAILSLLHRWFPHRYLICSAAAIELTLLHNFVWHMRYTWRDRRSTASALGRLVRFHLGNGVVSLLGNLALMRFLIGEVRLPVVLSNAVAIVCCSGLNFALGQRWTFADAG